MEPINLPVISSQLKATSSNSTFTAANSIFERFTILWSWPRNTRLMRVLLGVPRPTRRPKLAETLPETYTHREGVEWVTTCDIWLNWQANYSLSCDSTNNLFMSFILPPAQYCRSHHVLPLSLDDSVLRPPEPASSKPAPSWGTQVSRSLGPCFEHIIRFYPILDSKILSRKLVRHCTSCFVPKATHHTEDWRVAGDSDLEENEETASCFSTGGNVDDLDSMW